MNGIDRSIFPTVTSVNTDEHS